MVEAPPLPRPAYQKFAVHAAPSRIDGPALPVRTRSELVHLEKPGFDHDVANPASAPEMVVSLARLRTIRGRVLAADDGAHVPGARLALQRLKEAASFQINQD